MYRCKVSIMVLMAAVTCLLTAGCTIAETQMQFSRTRDFSFDWKYFKGDPGDAQQVDYDDSTWTDVNLPHDWSIAEPKDRKNPGGKENGYFSGGIGWYRKQFRLSPDEESKNIFVQFDGVYHNSEVWINGHSLGVRPYGYISFQHELTPYVRFGRDNVLAVRVDNTDQPNCRWYTGSGIYRHVHLASHNFP